MRPCSLHIPTINPSLGYLVTVGLLINDMTIFNGHNIARYRLSATDNDKSSNQKRRNVAAKLLCPQVTYSR
jgi:hypothetical protein